MTQPETTSACLVSGGVVVPPMMMTLTFSRGTWYFASTASSSGRAVPWMPMVLPAKSAGVLMPDSFRKKNAKGWRWNALAKALMGTPRLRPETSTPMDATLPTSAEPLATTPTGRSEEHTSELQSLAYLVCRLLLEKKKKHARVGR